MSVAREGNRVDGKAFSIAKQSWLNQIASDNELPPRAARVAIFLAYHMNFETLRSYPGKDTLAAETGLNVSIVKDALRALVERGHMTVRRRTGRKQTNQYTWIIRSEWSLKRGAPANPFIIEKGGVDAPLSSNPKGGRSTQKGGHSSSEKGGTGAPRTPYTTSEGTPDEEPGSAPAPTSSSDRSTPFDTGSSLQSEPSPVPATPAGRKPAGSEKRRSPEFEAACHRIVKVWAMEVSEGDAQAIQTALKSNTVDEICDHIRTDVSSVDLEACLQTLRRRKAA